MYSFGFAVGAGPAVIVFTTATEAGGGALPQPVSVVVASAAVRSARLFNPPAAVDPGAGQSRLPTVFVAVPATANGIATV